MSNQEHCRGGRSEGYQCDCGLTQEKLEKDYGLKGLDSCGLCNHAVGFHPSAPQTTSSSSQDTSGFISCPYCFSVINNVDLENHQSFCTPSIDNTSREFYKKESSIYKSTSHHNSERESTDIKGSLDLILFRIDNLSKEQKLNTQQHGITSFLYNVWNNSNSQSSLHSIDTRKKEFRKKASAFYNSEVCCVTGSTDDIIAAHLWPNRLRNDRKILPLLFISICDDSHPIDSPRNCIFLQKKIEKLYDKGKVTFIPLLKPGSYQFLVADNDLSNSVKKYNNKVINFHDKCRPYNRILALHYFVVANRYQIEIPQNFGTILRLSCTDADYHDNWLDNLIRSEKLLQKITPNSDVNEEDILSLGE